MTEIDYNIVAPFYNNGTYRKSEKLLLELFPEGYMSVKNS